MFQCKISSGPHWGCLLYIHSERRGLAGVQLGGRTGLERAPFCLCPVQDSRRRGRGRTVIPVSSRGWHICPFPPKGCSSSARGSGRGHRALRPQSISPGCMQRERKVPTITWIPSVDLAQAWFKPGRSLSDQDQIKTRSLSDQDQITSRWGPDHFQIRTRSIPDQD